MDSMDSIETNDSNESIGSSDITSPTDAEKKAYEVAEDECQRLMGWRARDGELFEVYRQLIVRVFLKGVEYAKEKEE